MAQPKGRSGVAFPDPEVSDGELELIKAEQAMLKLHTEALKHLERSVSNLPQQPENANLDQLNLLMSAAEGGWNTYVLTCRSGIPGYRMSNAVPSPLSDYLKIVREHFKGLTSAIDPHDWITSRAKRLFMTMEAFEKNSDGLRQSFDQIKPRFN